VKFKFGGDHFRPECRPPFRVGVQVKKLCGGVRYARPDNVDSLCARFAFFAAEGLGAPLRLLEHSIAFRAGNCTASRAGDNPVGVKRRLSTYLTTYRILESAAAFRRS
jgi:hypothetical protein